MNYLARLVLETSSTNPRPPHKIPRFLLPLVRIARKDERSRVGVLSLFNVYRMVYMDPVFDVESITSPFTGSWPDSEIGILEKAARDTLTDIKFKSNIGEHSYN